jgi:glycosyltransferase involved in cell wall biosynthesis
MPADKTPQKKISCYIIAFNEKDKIGEAINSVIWADEIVVADSFSTDGTAEIARSLGARVVQVPFAGFGDLRNKAIAACQYDWIFSLDSDERCTPEAKNEIERVLASSDALEAYYIPRKNFFMGRWINHSGYYPDYRQPQLFRKNVMKFKPDLVHEAFELSTNLVGYLKQPIWQIPFKNLEQIINKCNRYSSLGADKLKAKGQHASMGKALRHACWAFAHQYILRAGFLDGWPGFVLGLGYFEATFYKYAKLYELNANFQSPQGREDEQLS